MKNLCSQFCRLCLFHLFSQKQIDLPCFFISEVLERDKMRYYTLLNNIRTTGDWNAWIRFFLSAVKEQCEKYIRIISSINNLYEKHLDIACQVTNSSNVVEVMNALFKNPITSARQIALTTSLPMTSINRYLGQLVNNQIIYSDNRSRNRHYFYYDLLDILRQ